MSKAWSIGYIIAVKGALLSMVIDVSWAWSPLVHESHCGMKALNGTAYVANIGLSSAALALWNAACCLAIVIIVDLLSCFLGHICPNQTHDHRIYQWYSAGDLFGPVASLEPLNSRPAEERILALPLGEGLCEVGPGLGDWNAGWNSRFQASKIGKIGIG